MSSDLLYNILNLVVLPFWLLMIFAPRWTVTGNLMRSSWPVAIVPVMYVGLIAVEAMDIGSISLDFSLAGITEILSSQEAVLILWAHILALDLFAGRWIFLDGPENGLQSRLVSLFVFFTMMAGPAGLLFYLVTRSLMKKRPVDV